MSYYIKPSPIVSTRTQAIFEFVKPIGISYKKRDLQNLWQSLDERMKVDAYSQILENPNCPRFRYFAIAIAKDQC